MATAWGLTRQHMMRGLSNARALATPFWRSGTRRAAKYLGSGRRRMAPMRRRMIAPALGRMSGRLPLGRGGSLAVGGLSLRGLLGGRKSAAKVMAGKASARRNPWISYLKSAVRKFYRPGTDYTAFVKKIAQTYRRSH